MGRSPITAAENSEAGFANGILALANAGARVIADDVGYYDEPFFQDGIVAQAVTQVTSAGVAYFSSAGNQSNKSYESPYSGVYGVLNGYLGSWHDFNPGVGVDALQQITLPANSTTVISLQWDDPWYTTGGVQSDLDFGMFYADEIS